MNRDTASKTQYEDSKSHLSNYRKDDKIMLKRKLLSVLLALVLVASMAIPVFAERVFKAKDFAGKECTYLAYRDLESASGQFTYLGDYQLTASVTTYNWCNMHSEMLTANSTRSGYYDVKVTAGNDVAMDNTISYHTCTVSYAVCTGRIEQTTVFDPFTV